MSSLGPCFIRPLPGAQRQWLLLAIFLWFCASILPTSGAWVVFRVWIISLTTVHLGYRSEGGLLRLRGVPCSRVGILLSLHMQPSTTEASSLSNLQYMIPWHLIGSSSCSETLHTLNPNSRLNLEGWTHKQASP